MGVRAGYRLWTPIGVELMLEGGRHSVNPGLRQGRRPLRCPARAAVARHAVRAAFTLDSLRVGPNLRIMSGGESIRFTSTAGVVRCATRCASTAPTRPRPTRTRARARRQRQGLGPRISSWRSAFSTTGATCCLELDGMAFIDGASNITGKNDGNKVGALCGHGGPGDGGHRAARRLERVEAPLKLGLCPRPMTERKRDWQFLSRVSALRAERELPSSTRASARARSTTGSTARASNSPDSVLAPRDGRPRASTRAGARSPRASCRTSSGSSAQSST